MLDSLPPDLLSTILSFCDGKGISTLMMATLACHSTDQLQQNLEVSVDQRLTNLQNSIEPEQKNLHNWLDAWSKKMIRVDDETSSAASRSQCAIQLLQRFSEKCILLDYLEVAEHPRREWLVGCGIWEVHHLCAGPTTVPTHPTRCNVQVMTPCWDARAFVGWRILLKRDNHRVFEAHARNFVPVPPYGRIRGLTNRDEHILRTHASGMHQRNTVAELQRRLFSRFRNDLCTMRAVLVVSGAQARERQKMLGVCDRLLHSWVVQESHDLDLVCSWEWTEDCEELDVDGVMTSIRDLLETRSRLAV